MHLGAWFYRAFGPAVGVAGGRPGGRCVCVCVCVCVLWLPGEQCWRRPGLGALLLAWWLGGWLAWQAAWLVAGWCLVGLLGLPRVVWGCPVVLVGFLLPFRWA